VSLISCGTILHPERKGQVSGRIDPSIAVLNGLGLLLYFVPGIIAFAVDFSNGTIYLPDGRQTSLTPDQMRQLQSGELDAGELASEMSGIPINTDEVHISEVRRGEALYKQLAMAN
jgi:hypothetical protein